MRNFSSQGFSLLEVLLSIALFSLITVAFIGAILSSQQSTLTTGKRARAVFFAEEGLEAVRNIRDASFSNLTDGTFGVTTSSNTWVLSGESTQVDGFTRSVSIATIDSKSKYVTSTVLWQQDARRMGSISFVTLLSNWAAAGIGDWSAPRQETVSDLATNNDGLKIQVQGNYAYEVQNDGTPDFVIFDVSSTTLPVVKGSLSLSGAPTNIFVLGNYAYVTSDNNSRELQIINITNPLAPVLTGTYNASGSANATGVFVTGTTAYVVRASSSDDELLVVNVTVPAVPVLLDSLNLGAAGSDVIVLQNYAYISSESNSQELQVVNVTNPLLISQVGSLNLAGNNNANTLTGFDSIIVLGEAGGDLDVISVSTPSSPSLLGSLNIGGGNINDVALGNSNQYAYLGTSYGSAEFFVADITTPASPVPLGSLNLTGNINGVAYSESLDRAFGAGSDNSREFYVLAPQ